MGEYYGVRMKDDPDGEYLQHWGVPKGFMREGHKYLARLVTPSGYRYLYTQAQVAAAKAGKAIGNAIGLNQRNRAQQATARAQRISGGNKGREQSVQGIKRARMAKATAKRAQSAYDKTLLGRAEKAFNSARKSVGGALDDAGRYASKQARNIQRSAGRMARDAGKAVDNVVGGSAKKNLERQRTRYHKVATSPADFSNREQIRGRDARYENAQRAYSKAQRKYDRTLMGRAEKARENIGESANDLRRNVSKALSTASGTANRAARRVDNTLGITGEGRRNKKAAAYKQQMLDRAGDPNTTKRELNRRRSERTKGKRRAQEYIDVARRATDRYIRQHQIDDKTNIGRYAPKRKKKRS